MEEHVLALSKAKITLMGKPDTTFYTSLLLQLRHVWDNKVQTAATNGKEIKFNVKFFMGLNPEERIFLLLHEVLHVAYMHMLRSDKRDHAKWNQACDHVINLQLIDLGYKMPKMGLADPQYIGMSAEQVYDLLPTPDPSSVDQDIEPGDDSDDETQRALEDMIVQAAMQSKMAGDVIGSIPGDIQIFLDKLLNPRLSWRKILRKYIQSMAKNDYSFSRANRRYMPHIMPSMYSENLMNITIAVDSSGSVSNQDFLVFVSEVNGILKTMKPKKINLIQFDTEIISVDEVKSTHELSKVTFSGRGGTDISALMQWADKNKPSLLLVFTDGEFEFYNDKSKHTVLWMIHNNPGFTAPYGKVIHYNIEH
jgi:predicted metal-dependent peptidase